MKSQMPFVFSSNSYNADMFKKLLFPLILLLSLGLFAQDTAYVRMLADSLSTRYMAGRGYSDQGTLRAATFIMGQLKQDGIRPIGDSYFQDFTIPINTIRGKVKCSLDGKSLTPGTDFMVSSFSSETDAEFDLVILPKKAYKNLKKLKKYLTKGFAGGNVLVVDLKLAEDKDVKDLLRQGMFVKLLDIKGMVFINDGNPWWHVSRAFEEKPYWAVSIRREAWVDGAKKMHLSFGNHFYSEYPTQNVCAYIPGNSKADSFIVFTAHYDHLGMMGDDIWFPGCNDNGSGTAMLIDLARYFSQPENAPEYSIAFLFLSAEEAGLKGAYHFASNPLIDLTSIRLLINLDMVGSGSEGITVVNGSVYEDEFNRIKGINDEKHFLKEVKPRGEAANSDHHPFHEKGVPAFFIYTRGKEYSEYHTITDTGPLPFSAYEGLFRLMVESTHP